VRVKLLLSTLHILTTSVLLCDIPSVSNLREGDSEGSSFMKDNFCSSHSKQQAELGKLSIH